MPQRVADPGLYLHEELLLLVMRDDEGTVASGTMYSFAIGGAVLAELLLHRRISIETRRKSKLANLVDPKRIGAPLLDESLKKIAGARRRASLQSWVSRFANTKHLKHRVAQRLCGRGILRADEDKVLFLFTRKIYPELNPAPEREIVERMRKAIFTDTRNVDPRTVILISLAHHSGVLKAVFDKKKLRARKKRIEQLVNGEIAGCATQEAIEAMQAAVMVAAIMPAIITTTVVHS